MNYALHDTVINKIIYNKAGLEIYFLNGVYFLNEMGKETELSGPCRMVIKIDAFDSSKIYEHITVIKCRKSKVTEMNFFDFLRILEKDPFRIIIDYYSYFAYSILLKGYSGKYWIELIITEIANAEYVFDE